MCGVVDARDAVADKRVADISAEYEARLAAVQTQLAERDAEYLLIQEDVVKAHDDVTRISKQLHDSGRVNPTLIKMAQHLDSRCVLLSDPSTYGTWGSQPKHVSNPAKRSLRPI